MYQNNTSTSGPITFETEQRLVRLMWTFVASAPHHYVNIVSVHDMTVCVYILICNIQLSMIGLSNGPFRKLSSFDKLCDTPI